MDLIDLFEKYTNGDLSSEELEQFEKRLSLDSSFRKEFDDYRNRVLGIEAYFLRGVLRNHSAGTKDKNRHSGFNRLWVLLAVIALVITAIVLWLLFPKNESKTEINGSYASYFVPDPGLPTTMGASKQLVFLDAMVDYKKEKYISCIEKWEGLIQDNRENDTLYYFLGNAHQALNQYKPAEMYYQRVLNTSNSSFMRKAMFRLALLEAENGNVDQAVYYLNASNHPKATELLDKLSKD